MWFVKYGDQYLHDPRVSVFITDTSLTSEVNSSGEFKFTITKKHDLYNNIREHDLDNEITVYNDDELIFCGTVVEIDKDFQLTAEITCRGEMAYLNDSRIAPFSTLSTESGETAPDNLAKFFEWLIEQHNSQVDTKRQFVVGRNDGSSIVDGTFYLSDTSYSTTGSIIKDGILENYTSYITIEHKNGKRVINLLKDFDPVSAQVIDFGTNLLDFTDDNASDDISTVMIPLGASMKDTEYDYFDGYSLTEDITPDSSKIYYTHDTYSQVNLENIGTEDAPVYKFEDGVKYFEKVAKYVYTYASWDSCNPNVTYYYNNKLNEKKNLYYFEYGYQYFETDGNGNYWPTEDRTPNWDKTYYRYDYSSISDLKHFSRWEDGDRSGYDYYTRKANEFFIATSDSSPVHGKTYYSSPSNVSYTECDNPLSKFEATKSYFEYDGHADESNLKLTLNSGPFEIKMEEGYIKTGDKIICKSAVEKYGFITTVYEDSNINTREDLAKYGLIALKSVVSPIRSLEIKAIDLAMIKPDYEPIKIGQYIRARSRPHDLDSYFLCSKIEYDLNKPDNNTFTLGTTFDTLTGQQNKRIKSLNSTINTVYEAAGKISDDAKASAIIAGQAQTKAEDANTKADEAKNTADSANTKAEDANTKADEAKNTADSANTKADEARSKANDAIKNAKDASDAAADASKKADEASANITLIEDKVTTIKNSADQAIKDSADAKDAAVSAKTSADAANAAASNAQTAADAANAAASNAQNAADAAQTKADEAYTTAGNIASQVEGINNEITGIKSDASALRNDLQGKIETVTNTMTADYAKKTDLSSVESSLKTEIETSAAGIRSEVSQTYVTNDKLNSIQIGGRNLLVNTNSDNLGWLSDPGNGTIDHTSAISRSLGSRYDKFTITKKSTSWCYVGINDPDAIKKVIREGGDFTLSFNVFCDAAVTISEIKIQNGDGSNEVLDFGYFNTIAAEWTKIVLTGKVISGIDYDSQIVYISLMPLAEESLIEFTNIKLEKGNKATDWTPAPEDVESSITNLANTVETNYSTKSEVKQLSDQVSSTVSSIEEVKINTEAAQSKADEAVAAASNARSTADAAKANADAARSTADTAKENADTAQTAADAAKKAAAAAQSKADEATTNLVAAEKNLEDLQSRADATDEQVAAAQKAVENAKKAAEDAQANAASAATAASNAQSTADTAKANADAAQTAADNAVSVADTAQTTANIAKKVAEDAQADIDSLKNRVTTAETKITQNSEEIEMRATKTEVETVKTTAETANSTANNAQIQLDNKGLRKTVIDLLDTTIYDADTYYPVVGNSIPRSGYHTFEVNNQLESNSAPSWSTHDRKGFTCNLSARMIANGWGQVGSQYGWIDNASYSWCDKMPAYITQMEHSSLPVFYLRGGGKYNLYTDYDCTWSIKTDTYTYNSNSVTPTNEPSNYSKLVNNWDVVNRVTTAETKIDQNSEAITLSATKTEITEAIDNIQVGGRNLLVDTSNPITHTGTGSTNQGTLLYKMSDYYNSISVLKGRQLTMSFDWETTATSGKFLVQLNDSPWSDLSGWITPDSSNQSGKSVYTATCYANFDTGSYTGIKIRSDNLTGTVTIKNAMLEFGNKASSWQIAPEDVDEDVTTKTNNALTGAKAYTDAQLKITSESIASTVSKTYATQSALDETNQNVRTAQSTANSAINNVSNMEKRVDDIKGLTNDALSTAQTAAANANTARNDVDALKTRVSEAESNITQNSDAISLRVTKTEVIDTVNNIQNNIQVGGTNLARNTKAGYSECDFNNPTETFIGDADYTLNFDSSLGFGVASWATSMNMYSYCGPYYTTNTQLGISALTIGETYTISCYIKLDNMGDPLKEMTGYISTPMLCSTQEFISGSDGSYGASWTRVYAVFKAIKTSNPVCFYGGCEMGAHAYMYGLKVERGNKPTDWSPAPEDIEETYITQTELTQTSEEIRMDFNKSISSTSDDLHSQMIDNNTIVNNKLTEINKYIRFVDGKIILGESGNPLILTIQNDRVSFTQSGVEVAYFSNNNLYVKETEVIRSLNIGNYKIFPREDGALTLRKK